MIAVTRLNGSSYYVNALLIETVEATPDTVLTLTSGKKLVVAETVPDLIRAIETFYRRVGLVGHVETRHEMEIRHEEGK
jgi:flagellar protein FlbD